MYNKNKTDDILVEMLKILILIILEVAKNVLSRVVGASKNIKQM